MATEHDEAILNSLFNPFTPIGEVAKQDEELLNDEDDKDDGEDEVAIRLEVEGVREAENGHVDQSLEIFTRAIQCAPKRASVYNNRAQAYRLKGNTAAALEDLNNAINLSEGKGRAGRQAYCQRALIHLLQEHDEDALADFKMAAKLGSEFAKTQIVKMNPYAALCNQMLGEMFSKLGEN